MAYSLFDYNQFKEPNLLIPGRKPIGPVKVNESAPYASELITCIPLTSSLRDLRLGYKPNSATGLLTIDSGAPGWNANGNGRCVSTDQVGAWGDVRSLVWASGEGPYLDGTYGGAGWTVLMVGRINHIQASYSNYPTLLQTDGGTGGIGIDHTGTFAAHRSGAYVTTSNSLSVDDYFSLVVTGRYVSPSADYEVDMYLNGIKSSGSKYAIVFLGNILELGGATGYSNSHIDLNHFAIWDRALPDSICRQYNADPFLTVETV